MADSKKLVLPLEYQEVEYIENTGTTQYIDTGWKRDFNKDFEIEAVIKPSTINKRYCIISDYSSQYQYNMSFEVTGDNFGRVFINAANNLVGTHIYNSNEFNILKYSYDHTTPSGTVEVNSGSDSKTYQTDVRRIAIDNARIFVDKDSRFSVFNYSFKLQKMRIKEDNILVRNFIPCYRKSDNEAGLYDTVNDVFYTNQGTGTFTVGANVSSWLHSLRKLTTATEAVENPLYSDGSPITAYTLKGNTTQSGTPTPSNPVEVSGVGERTENLFNATWESGSIGNAGGNLNDTNAIRTAGFIACEAEKLYSFSPELDVTETWVNYYDNNGGLSRYKITDGTFTTPQGCTRLRFRLSKTDIGISPVPQPLSMLNVGTPLPYEPYGYKIPISSGGVTTNIYISAPLQKLYTYSDNLQSDGTIIRNIGKVELTGDETVEYISNYGQFKIQTSYYRRPPYDETSYLCTHYRAISNAASWTGDNYITVSQGDTPDRFYRIKDSRYSTAEDFKTYLAQQYANGTPVTIYFVKTVATTETITAPSIPTTEGANSITVDTTVQPSEFTATWTGWHNAEVKEKSDNLCDYSTFADNYYLDITTGLPKEYSSTPNRIATLTPCDVTNINTVTLSYTSSLSGDTKFIYSLFNGNTLVRRVADNDEGAVIDVSDGDKLYLSLYNVSYTVTVNTISSLMLNEGSTALPYEPYWK